MLLSRPLQLAEPLDAGQVSEVVELEDLADLDGAGWGEGCVGCSFESDHVEGALVHLENHDVSYVAVSRAPLAEIEPFRRRMGWRFRWVSSFGSDFNYDFNVSFTPEEVAAGRGFYNYRIDDAPAEELSGFSVFHKDASGGVFHTYSTYGRGAEEVLGTYMLARPDAQGPQREPQGQPDGLGAASRPL